MPTIKKLHPTLKACKCGFIGTRGQLYIHFSDAQSKLAEELRSEMGVGVATKVKFNQRYYSEHGEVVLNEDDPRLDLSEQLKESLK
jgi:hypothetical protein